MFDQLAGTPDAAAAVVDPVACATPVLLAGRESLIREGLRVLLEEFRFAVRATLADKTALLAALAAMPHSLVVVLCDPQPGAGLSPAETAELCARFPRARLIIVSPLDEIIHAPRYLKAGACSYVMTGRSSSELRAALRAAEQGELHLSEELQKHMNRAAFGERSPDIADLLTSREMEMFLLYGKGYRNAEIARATQISIKTVDSYRQRIKQKLNLRNAAEFTRLAIRYANQH